MKTIFYVTILVLLGACQLDSTCKKITLSQQELDWFKNYKKGEIRLYKNQFGEIDTFRLSTKPEVYTTPCNRIEIGEFQYQSIELPFDLLGENFKKKKDRAFTIHFTKRDQRSSDHNCKKRFNLHDLGTKAILDMNDIDLRSDTLLLTNSLIQVYHFTSEKNLEDTDYGSTNYKSFDVSKKYGLVRYETEKGEIYNYWKKI